jgi:hypothetical protein
MATTTPNYGWTVPTSTDLVKDGATAIETLGDAIDASMNTALGTKKAGMVLLNTTSFSAVASQSINSVFSATYDFYRILFYHTKSTTNAISMRFRTSGTDNSNSSYSFSSIIVGSSVTGGRTTGNTSISLIDNDSDEGFSFIDVYNPFASLKTGYSSISGVRITNPSSRYNQGGFDATTSFDGFSLIASTGTITGRVSTFGVNQ